MAKSVCIPLYLHSSTQYWTLAEILEINKGRPSSQSSMSVEDAGVEIMIIQASIILFSKEENN